MEETVIDTTPNPSTSLNWPVTVPPSPDVKFNAAEVEPSPPSNPSPWIKLAERLGPWLAVVIIGLVVWFAGPRNEPYIPPPIPAYQSVPPDHTQTITTDPAGKVRMTTTPNPK